MLKQGGGGAWVLLERSEDVWGQCGVMIKLEFNL